MSKNAALLIANLVVTVLEERGLVMLVDPDSYGPASVAPAQVSALAPSAAAD